MTRGHPGYTRSAYGPHEVVMAKGHGVYDVDIEPRFLQKRYAWRELNFRSARQQVKNLMSGFSKAFCEKIVNDEARA